MWAKIKPNLFEHIDGLHSNWKNLELINLQGVCKNKIVSHYREARIKSTLKSNFNKADP